MADVIRLENVSRRFKEGEGQLEVFSSLNMELQPGEIVALVGPSGAGKSSLLHIAGLLEAPSSGEIYIAGAAASRLPEQERTRIRRDTIGFVYQAHHLLPEFDALENVILPQMIAGKSRAQAAVEAARLLGVLGLGKRLTHRPSQLSGGEQQRVAIARAVVARPDLLIADEPTGNVDPEMGARLIRLIAELNRLGTTVLIATHDRALIEATRAREMRLVEGRLVELRANE